ncbi:MAG: CvpA family protein [Limosilactobacillus sp.]|uniref:CvpA family protein n=1 Tax=Limosilactobacillus sp. TaxID=2773925 RepID=UPI0027036FE7|nr:CvpA family protein [Limosilactobacillus sp.]
MVLTTLIIVILAASYLHGHHRGLLMMVLYSAAYIISWIAARLVAPVAGSLVTGMLPNVSDSSSYSGSLLSSVDLNGFFSRGIAFILVFSIVSFFCHWFIRRISWVSRLPIIGTIDRLLGGILAFAIGYIIIFVVLLVIQLYPGAWWQLQMANSGLARWIINQTPELAQLVMQAIG